MALNLYPLSPYTLDSAVTDLCVVCNEFLIVGCTNGSIGVHRLHASELRNQPPTEGRTVAVGQQGELSRQAGCGVHSLTVLVYPQRKVTYS